MRIYPMITGEESIQDGYQEDDNVNMDDKEVSFDQEMKQKMVDEDSMDDNEPENDLSINVRGKKHGNIGNKKNK